MAAKMVKTLDTSGDGSVDKKEFVAGLSAKGVSAEDAAKQFDKIDTKKTGSVTQADIESSIKSSGGKSGAPSGAPPAGGGKGAGGAGQAGGSSSASSTKTYDKKDANQDGTVSNSEELVYEIKHPNAAGSDKQASSLKSVGTNIDVTA